MLSSGSGGQPRGAGRRVQAGCGLESGTSGLRCRHFAALCVLTLAGCSSFPSSVNPVSWWHGLQGGKIAEERPPPPGADQPYPNLATVPPKPAQPDRAALDNIASALIADRTNAQHVAAEAPIADPSVPSASPALFGRGTVAAATSCAAIWDCEGERHHGGGRGTACPAHAAYPTEHRKPDGGIAGQGAGRCGAERAACSARCRGTAALYPGRGATSIANRPPGAAQSAGCSAGDGIVGFCWRITWTWMESRAASAGHCHEGRCGNADVAASGQAGRPSQRRQRDVRHRLRRAAVFRRR